MARKTLDLGGMKPNRVIALKSIQPRFPLMPTLTMWMLLDYTKADGWIWGVVGTMLVILWGGWIYRFFTDEVYEINETGDFNKKK